MRSIRKSGLVLALAAGSFGTLSLHAAARSDVRLLLSHETANPGDTVVAGIHLRSPAGWHTYWRYSGDSGEPTSVSWSVPAGVKLGEMLWPTPDKLIEVGFTTYIYHDEVLLLTTLMIPTGTTATSMEFRATVAWQECEKVCVVGKAEVKAVLQIGPAAKLSTNAAMLDAWQSKVPGPQDRLIVTADWEKGTNENPRPLIIEWDASTAAKEIDFYPLVGGDFTVKGETEIVNTGPGKAKLRKLVEKIDGPWPTELSGVVVEKGDTIRAREVRFGIDGSTPAPPRAATTPAPATGAATYGTAGTIVPIPASRSLTLILVFAFVGGLILNVMPCVLPVIALKVLSFVNQSKESPARGRALGLVYGLGVLTSFLALALVAVGVEAAGGQATWGMLLQNQIFRVLMTVLMALVALNLFGVFEVTLSGRVMGAADGLASREGFAGAFFNGVLATVLATPCTAPFMSVALAFAFLAKSAAVTTLVFLTVGLGLAAPFVILCWTPAWLKFLPKPGAWMERLKIAMGFPMLAAAVWVFWFTAPNYGESGVLWLGLFLVVLAGAAWVWGEFVQRGTKRRWLAIAIALLSLAFGYGWILEGQLDWRTPHNTRAAAGSLKEGPDGIDWKVWSPEAVVQARTQGRPVLVDFTARNCINCQVNKRTSVEIPSTREKLKAIDAVALLGDFSNNDPLIAAELRRFGRPGVPLVLVYPRDPAKPPIVLPEILTPGIVSDALDEAAQ